MPACPIRRDKRSAQVRWTLHSICYAPFFVNKVHLASLKLVQAILRHR
jgi:hypothetical protein